MARGRVSGEGRRLATPQSLNARAGPSALSRAAARSPRRAGCEADGWRSSERTPMQYVVVVEQGEHNWSAYAPDVWGCAATGATREEVERNIREALPSTSRARSRRASRW